MGGSINSDDFKKLLKTADRVTLSDSLFKNNQTDNVSTNDEIFKVKFNGNGKMPNLGELVDSAKNYENNSKDFKETIASIESASSGLYDAYNPYTHATGKYQFLPSYHKDVVRSVLGISWNEFKHCPECQERYMDYWITTTLKPQARKIMQEIPNTGLSESQIMALIHFKGAGGARQELSNPQLLNKATKTNISSNNYINRFN